MADGVISEVTTDGSKNTAVQSRSGISGRLAAAKRRRKILLGRRGIIALMMLPMMLTSKNMTTTPTATATKASSLIVNAATRICQRPATTEGSCAFLQPTGYTSRRRAFDSWPTIYNSARRTISSSSLAAAAAASTSIRRRNLPRPLQLTTNETLRRYGSLRAIPPSTISSSCRRRRDSSRCFCSSGEESFAEGDEFESIQSASSKTPQSRFITYVTDIEGDRDYLERYVRNSKILFWRKTATHVSDASKKNLGRSRRARRLHFPYDVCIDFIDNDSNNNNVLVFGGDIWDQGGSDLFVVRQLLHLRRRYPDTVYFVAGNRDLNKMRFVQELGEPGAAAPTHPGVYWLRGTGREGDPLRGPLHCNTKKQNDPVQRLQWMLAQTMGSPRAFGHRQWELQQERQCAGQYDSVSDEDVVESYRRSCHPVTGEMAEYFEACHLFLRLGQVAFVHGALPLTTHNLQLSIEQSGSGSLWDDLSFAMPWLKEQVTARGLGVESIDDWINELNQFAQRSVQAWRAYDTAAGAEKMWAYTGGYNLQSIDQQPFGQLLQYGMGATPDRLPNPTVVYNSWGVSPRSAAAANQPRKFFRHDRDNQLDRAYVRHTQEFFERTGLRLVCSGHQPVGEMPNHIRVEQNGAQPSLSWVLSCDTSYSGDTMRLSLPEDRNPPMENLGRGQARSGRGSVAVSEVIIEQCCRTGDVLEAYCHGTLCDGTEYTSERLDLSGTSGRLLENSEALTVGTLASGPLVPNKDNSPHGGPWWTQAAFNDGSFLLAAGEGFKFWTRRIRPFEISEPTLAGVLSTPVLHAKGVSKQSLSPLDDPSALGGHSNELEEEDSASNDEDDAEEDDDEDCNSARQNLGRLNLTDNSTYHVPELPPRDASSEVSATNQGIGAASGLNQQRGAAHRNRNVPPPPPPSQARRAQERRGNSNDAFIEALRQAGIQNLEDFRAFMKNYYPGLFDDEDTIFNALGPMLDEVIRALSDADFWGKKYCPEFFKPHSNKFRVLTKELFVLGKRQLFFLLIFGNDYGLRQYGALLRIVRKTNVAFEKPQFIRHEDEEKSTWAKLLGEHRAEVEQIMAEETF